MRSWSLCFVALELLPHAFAFLAPVRLGSPAGGWVSRSIGSVISNSNRIMLRPQLSTVKMDASASSIESAVLKYKNFLGSKRWQDLGEPKAEAASVFEEICNIYGEENAIKMVQAVPNCLSYNPSVFQATFDAFCEVFPPEDTKGMVTRNPNLLAVRPRGFGGAANAKQDTMTMSYIIAFTRPLGPVLLGGLFLLLALPFIERFGGISRDQILSAVTGGSG